MKRAKIVLGLWREDLKSKLWMIVAVWYLMGMLCLLFSAKMTIPEGEVRSLYVGPGNTSFLLKFCMVFLRKMLQTLPLTFEKQQAVLQLFLFQRLLPGQQWLPAVLMLQYLLLVLNL